MDVAIYIRIGLQITKSFAKGNGRNDVQCKERRLVAKVKGLALGDVLGVEQVNQPLDVLIHGRFEVVDLLARVAGGHLGACARMQVIVDEKDRKSTRLNSSHSQISYAVFCLKKKKKKNI